MGKYNKNDMKISINEFQHPKDIKTINNVLSVPAFEKVLGFASKYSIERKYAFWDDSSLIKISEEMSPKLFEMLNEALEMLNCTKKPKIYVKRSYEFQLETRGIQDPHIILSSTWLEMIDDEILWANIVACVCAIVAKHSEIKFVDETINNFKAFIPTPITITYDVAINDWYRNNAYTYDRAVLLATDNFELAAKNILFGDATDETLDNLSLAEPNNDYYKQAMEFLNSSNDVSAIKSLNTIFSRQQWAASRYVELYNWCFSGEYQDIKERGVQ